MFQRKLSGRAHFYNVRERAITRQSARNLWTRSADLAPKQLNIFSHTGLHTVVRDVKEALNSEVKESGQSRDQVLDKMNELARRHSLSVNGKAGVSKDLFEKWLNAEDDSRVPGLKSLVLLCAALETVGPISAMLEPLGGRVIGPEEAKLLEWAKAYHASKEMRKRMRKIEEELG